MTIKAVPGTLGDMIGFDKPDELTAILKETFKQENFSSFATMKDSEIQAHKNTLKIAANRYLDLWEAINS